MADLIDRQDAIDAVKEAIISDEWEYAEKALERLPSAQTEPCEDAVSKSEVLETYSDLYDVFDDNQGIIRELHKVYDRLNALPSAQPDGWLEQNKDKILQAGMEGREIDFHIGGRLFAIREKAQ